LPQSQAGPAFNDGVDILGAYCHSDGFCRKRGQAGDSCLLNGGGSNSYRECAPGHVCKGETGKSTCVRVLRAGEDCSKLDWLDDERVCADGTQCGGGRCRATAYGAPCEDDTGCSNLDDAVCAGGFCQLEDRDKGRRDDGLRCRRNAQCKSNICLFKETDCSDSNKTCEATYTGGRLYGSFGLACEEAKCDDTARCQARFSLPNGTLTAGPDGYNQPQACASRSTDSATGACTNTDIEPGTPCAGACSGYRMSCACSADVFSLGLLGTCQRMPCDEEFVRLRTCKEKLYYVAASYDEFTCGEQAAGYYECLRNSQGLGFAGAATSRLSKIAVTALVFSTLLMTLVVVLVAVAGWRAATGKGFGLGNSSALETGKGKHVPPEPVKEPKNSSWWPFGN